MAHVRRRGKAYQARWKEPSGLQRTKSFRGPGAEQAAHQLIQRVQAELNLGIYQPKPQNIKWADFAREYRDRIIEPQAFENAEMHLAAIKRFEKIIQPTFVGIITEKDIEKFIAHRRQEPGRNEDTLSPATINKDLRYLKTMLKTTHEWGYHDKLIGIKLLREPERVKPFVSPEEFSRIYRHCPDDWWRGFLLFGFMTGWRLTQILSLKWKDVDLERGDILSDADDNKGKRDVLLPLHGILREALQRLPQEEPAVFPHKGDETRLYAPFAKIQQAAGIRPRNKRKAGRWYTFHDLRRGFATANAEHLDLFELQKLMQHKDITTTQKYVAMAHRMKDAVGNLKVPEL